MKTKQIAAIRPQSVRAESWTGISMAGFFRLPLFLSLLGTLCLVAPKASAQVSYVQQIMLPDDLSFILTTVTGPINTSDPAYDPDLPESPILAYDTAYYLLNPFTGIFQGPIAYPTALKIDQASIGTISGRGTPRPIVYLTGPRFALFAVSLTENLVKFNVRVEIVKSSLAASREGNLTIIGSTAGQPFGGFTVDPTTGAFQLVFGDQGEGSGPGQFSDTLYHAYGQNDLLYVLDYGNNRVQILDPESNFDFVSAFTLEAGVTTANMQFAIGANGNIYLGDGLGGGTAYDEHGIYLGAFTPTLPLVVDEFSGGHYLSTDKYGHVYVLDGSGFNQYLDASVVPEPAVGMLVFLGLGVLSCRRARK